MGSLALQTPLPHSPVLCPFYPNASNLGATQERQQGDEYILSHILPPGPQETSKYHSCRAGRCFVANSSHPRGMGEPTGAARKVSCDDGESIPEAAWLPLRLPPDVLLHGTLAGRPGSVGVWLSKRWLGRAQFLPLTGSWNLLEFLLPPAGCSKLGRFFPLLLFLQLFSCSGASGPSSFQDSKLWRL